MFLKIGHMLILFFLFVGTFNLLAGEGRDACALIQGPEIEAVQGEEVAQAKGSQRSSGGYFFANCFYALPTYNKSVSLQLTLPDSSSEKPASPKQQWHDVFHSEKTQKEKEKEEKESDPPRLLSGLGDEAFWVKDRVVGVLYVLKGDSFFRISLGGDEPEESRMEKSKELAQKILGRL